MGLDLRWDWAKDVLESLTMLWKRPVRLDTLRGKKWLRLGHDGRKPSEEFIEQSGKEEESAKKKAG